MVYRYHKCSKSSWAWAVSLTNLFSSRVLWLSEWHLVAQVWHLGVIHDTSHVHIPTCSQSPNPLDCSSCKSLSPSTSAQGEGHSPPDYQVCARRLTPARSLGVLGATLTSDTHTHTHTHTHTYIYMLVTQLCLTLCDHMDCNPPGFSVHGILQARILEWVAISFARGSFQPGIKLRSPALRADSLPSEPPGKSFASGCLQIQGSPQIPSGLINW